MVYQNKKLLTISGIFNTGFYEFDQNFVFLNLSDALSIFDKEEKNEQNLKFIYQKSNES